MNMMMAIWKQNEKQEEDETGILMLWVFVRIVARSTEMTIDRITINEYG